MITFWWDTQKPKGAIRSYAPPNDQEGLYAPDPVLPLRQQLVEFGFGPLAFDIFKTFSTVSPTIRSIGFLRREGAATRSRRCRKVIGCQPPVGCGAAGAQLRGYSRSQPRAVFLTQPRRR
jgi:hypothetical protein